MEVQLNREDLGLLMRPVAGQGGWQSLLRKLQKQIDGNTLTLTQIRTHAGPSPNPITVTLTRVE